MPLPSLVLAYFQRGPIYARVNTSLPDHQAWVAVYKRPQNYQPFNAPKSGKYILHFVEVRNDILARCKEKDEYLPEHLATTYEIIYVSDNVELESTLLHYMDDLNALGPPWKCDYPHFG